jgi:hypothetical protein
MTGGPGSNDPPAWVAWVAQDADGVWWGFEVEPLQCDTGWYENEVGRYVRIRAGEPNPAWRSTLERLR